MSSFLISTEDWQVSPSGLWSIVESPASFAIPAFVANSPDQVIHLMSSASNADAGPSELPFAAHVFPDDSPLNLDFEQPVTELRFWLKGSRVGLGTPSQPFYLAFDVVNNTLGLVWTRLIRVSQPNTWDLYRLWVGADDIPVALRQSIELLRVRCLDVSQSFSLMLGDVLATTLEPLRDADVALTDRISGLTADLTNPSTGPADPNNVPVIIDVPENVGDRVLPYILITPWAVQPQEEQGGAGPLMDNYTEGGMYVRPTPWRVQLDYSIDVYASDRLEKTVLLEQIIRIFNRQPYLIVNGQPLDLVTAFVPSPEEKTEFAAPGRTPLFYRIVVYMERQDREFRRAAIAPSLGVSCPSHLTLVETVDI